MDNNRKKEALKDILSVLKTKKTDEENLIAEITKSEITDSSYTDITEIEDAIPIIDDDDDIVLINNGNEEKNDKKDNIQETKKPKTEEKIETKEEKTSTKNLDKQSYIEFINKIENLEQKINSLDETKKQLDQKIVNQSREIEKYYGLKTKLEKENQQLKQELSNADKNIRIDLEAQLSKAGLVEEKYQKLTKQHEELKTRVRRDLRKIKMRENELTNKIELIQQDSETLIKAKDEKILQLRKQITDLEYEIDKMKDKVEYYKNQARESHEKAERVVKALKLSTSLLESPEKEKK